MMNDGVPSLITNSTSIAPSPLYMDLKIQTCTVLVNFNYGQFN